MKKLYRYCQKIVHFCVLILLSFITNIIIKIVPFKILIKLFTNSTMLELEPLTIKQRRVLFLSVDRLYKIADHVPWRVKCFESALIILLICRIYRLNIAVNFGLKRDADNQMSAHAWTFINDVVFTGAPEYIDYKTVFCRSYIPKRCSLGKK